MRVRTWLVTAATSLSLSLFLGSGCGGTEAGGTDASTTPPPAPDTAPAVDAPADTAPIKEAGKDTAVPCDPTIDPFASVPDASVGDSGLTTGACLGCARRECNTEIQACVTDCACQGPVSKVLTCVLGAGGFTQAALLSCAGDLLTAPQSVQNKGLAIAGCLQTKCAAECIPAGLDGGTDARRD